MPQRPPRFTDSFRHASRTLHGRFTVHGRAVLRFCSTKAMFTPAQDSSVYTVDQPDRPQGRNHGRSCTYIYIYTMSMYEPKKCYCPAQLPGNHNFQNDYIKQNMCDQLCRCIAGIFDSSKNWTSLSTQEIPTAVSRVCAGDSVPHTRSTKSVHSFMVIWLYHA